MIRLKKLLEIGNISEKQIEKFADTRKDGAQKITFNALEKGGLALLTWHHFKVKLPYYEKAASGQLNYDMAKKQYNELLERLYSSTKNSINIDQIEFQELVGKLEVLGELIINYEKG